MAKPHKVSVSYLCPFNQRRPIKSKNKMFQIAVCFLSDHLTIQLPKYVT